MIARIDTALLTELTQNLSPSESWKLVTLLFKLLEEKKRKVTLSSKTFSEIVKVCHKKRLTKLISQLNRTTALKIKEEGDKIEIHLNKELYLLNKPRKSPTVLKLAHKSKEKAYMTRIRAAYHPRRALTQVRQADKEFLKIMNECTPEEQKQTVEKILTDIETRLKKRPEWEEGKYVQGLGNYLVSRAWEVQRQNRPNIKSREVNSSSLKEIDALINM